MVRLKDLLVSERDALFRKYVARRDTLFKAIEESEAAASRRQSGVGRQVAIAGALAIPSAALIALVATSPHQHELTAGHAHPPAA